MSENPNIKRLARRLAALERELRNISTPQLAYSSIHDGAIREYDEEGNLVGVIGRQPDGSHGYVVLDGPVPPTPDKASIYLKPGFYRASWNGIFLNPDTGEPDPSIAAPTDFSRVEIHVGQSADFEPDTDADSDTRVATIASPRGGVVTQIVEPGTYYVRLVTVTTAGKVSAPSEAVEVEVEPALDQSELIADLEALERELEAAREWIEQTGYELDRRLAQAESDLADAGTALANAKSRLDTAFGVDSAFSVTTAVNQAKAEALSLAAQDAQQKADAARAAAEQAAKDYADGQIDAATYQTLLQAAQDAQQKADAAKTAAEQYAAQVANQAKAEALAAAAADAQQKADAAKAAAEQAAKDYADGRIDEATYETLQQAAADAQQKADAAKAAAEAAAKAYTDSVAAELADDIASAQQTADTAMMTASGKSAVFYSTGNPSGSGTRVGDIWRKRNASTGTIEGEWYWNGSQWLPVDYGDAVLRSLDVGKLTVGTGVIDQAVIQEMAAKLANIIQANVGNLFVTEGATINQAVIDKLWTDVVRSRKITTDMLLVGAGENLLVDPTFADPDLTAHRFAQSIGTWTTGTSSEDSQRYVASSNAGGTAVLNLAPSPDADYSPVVPGGTYRIKGRFQGAGRSVRPRITYRRGDGTTETVVLSWSALGSWDNREWEWVAPSDAAEARFDIELSPDAVRVYIKHLSVTSKTDASLIVDGAIKGRHVDAEEVAAELAEFVQVKAENILAGNLQAALAIEANASLRVGGTDERHVLAEGGAVKVMQPGGSNPDGSTLPAKELIVMGGPGAAFTAYDNDGDELGGIRSDGSIYTPQLDAGVITLDGDDLLEIIDGLPKGTIVWSGPQSGTLGPYSTRTGVWEFAFDAYGGRRYRIDITGAFNRSGGSAEAVIVRLIKTEATLGTTPAAPTVNGTLFPPNLRYVPDGWIESTLTYWFQPSQNESTRWLFCIEPFSGATCQVRNFAITVTDLGPNPENTGQPSQGGAGGSTPPSNPAPKDFVLDFGFTYDSHATWTQYGRVTQSAYKPHLLRHGLGGSSRYRAYLPLIQAARDKITGADSIGKIALQLTAAQDNHNVRPWIGTINTTNVKGATEPTISNLALASDGNGNAVTFRPGERKWITLTSAQVNALRNGTAQGIAIGRTDQSLTLISFYGTTAATANRPKIRVWGKD